MYVEPLEPRCVMAEVGLSLEMTDGSSISILVSPPPTLHQPALFRTLAPLLSTESTASEATWVVLDSNLAPAKAEAEGAAAESGLLEPPMWMTETNAPNDGWWQAQALPTYPALQIEGQVSAQDVVDMFAIRVGEWETPMQIVLSKLDPDVDQDLILWLYDNRGKSLGHYSLEGHPSLEVVMDPAEILERSGGLAGQDGTVYLGVSTPELRPDLSGSTVGLAPPPASVPLSNPYQLYIGEAANGGPTDPGNSPGAPPSPSPGPDPFPTGGGGREGGSSNDDSPVFLPEFNGGPSVPVPLPDSGDTNVANDTLAFEGEGSGGLGSTGSRVALPSAVGGGTLFSPDSVGEAGDGEGLEFETVTGDLEPIAELLPPVNEVDPLEVMVLPPEVDPLPDRSQTLADGGQTQDPLAATAPILATVLTWATPTGAAKPSSKAIPDESDEVPLTEIELVDADGEVIGLPDLLAEVDPTALMAQGDASDEEGDGSDGYFLEVAVPGVGLAAAVAFGLYAPDLNRKLRRRGRRPKNGPGSGSRSFRPSSRGTEPSDGSNEDRVRGLRFGWPLRASS